MFDFHYDNVLLLQIYFGSLNILLQRFHFDSVFWTWHMGSHLVFRRVVREEKPDKITAWWLVTMMRVMAMFSSGHHLPPWSLEAVLEAFLDRDLAWTLACLFFSSDLANFLPQESHVKGFSPTKSKGKINSFVYKKN